MKIILASGSPRRKELMKQLLDKYNMEFEVQASNINEETIKKTITEPNKLVEELSHIKAQDIFNQNKNKYDELIVIGADTIVYFNNGFLGKPKDKDDAIHMLEALQGQMNEVYTGMTVIIKIKKNIDIKKISNCSQVYMKDMSNQDILEYINTKEPMDKAGAYAIQGIGSKYIERYSGSFNSIVGLDIEELEKLIFIHIINERLE